VPASDETIAEAEKRDLSVAGEVISKRTKYSRTFGTNDPTMFVTEVIGGEPQYYQDPTGEWWQADYATTTRESFDHQMETKEEGIVGRILNFISSLLLPKASADTSTFYPDPNGETSSVDGMVWRAVTNQTWANVHDGAGVRAWRQ
jgi:hypothetical protein